jgi:molybdopterin/thiamine biosynthesis adenylyltransferase
MSEEP